MGGASGGATSLGGTTAKGGTTGGAGTTTGSGGTSSSGGANSGGGPGSGGANTGGGNTNTGGATGVGGGTAGSSGGVTVDLGSTQQTIQGFGINDTWNPLTSAQATSLFSATSGIGMTILRVGMSSTGASYNSSESSNISTAKSAGATKIIGSVWTAAANCKDNNSLTERRPPELELLRLVVNDDSQLRQEQWPLRHVIGERA